MMAGNLAELKALNLVACWAVVMAAKKATLMADC